MKKTVTMDGNEACSTTAYMFTEIAGIYPITPSSPMAEHVDEWSVQGRTNIWGDQVKVIEMQSELGAAGMVHGTLVSGLLTTTFTASQGLLLMLPNMYKIAGEMLPCVIHVAARSIATHALSIFGDHQDVYAARQTGFAILASSNVQDAAYLSGIAHLSAIKSSIPFMHFFDGFRTSHEINKIEVLDIDDYKKLLDYEALENFRKRALNPLKPIIRGTNQNDDIYFQNVEARNKFYDELPDIVNEYMQKINEIAKTDYKPFNYYGSKNATKVIIAMGSINDTIKETIDTLNEDIGVIEVHLYRPFSTKYLLNILPDTVNKIAVLDRTKEPGSNGEPLYLDVVNALKDKNITIVGGRYGLSSKNTTPAMIKAVYDMLDNPKNNFTIGINDDVTCLSLDYDSNFKIDDAKEFLVYGYGSDGMVSAGKSLIKMIGDNTDNYVQGYFEYDSKKSGGITVSHLRFSDSVIKKPYYVINPELVVVTKDSYLNDLDVFNNLKENGLCIINTSKEEDELISSMNSNNIQNLINKKIKVYTINAYELARKVGLQNKISMIIETAIIKISNLYPFDEAKEILKKYVYNKFSKKGEEIVNSNYEGIEKAESYLKLINLKANNNIKTNENFYNMLYAKKGNELKVSDFLKYYDGTYETASSSLDKRIISDIVPKWISNNCITCNMCSYVCPHSVIRPFLLDEDEYESAPDFIKERCIKPINPNYKDYYFMIAISIDNCTGCGLCINSCPGKGGVKALINELHTNQTKEKEQIIFNYLKENIKEKITNKNNIFEVSLCNPKIEYPGACAGCGEPTYIKILTQLFGKHMVIANATGCSSIYGGSLPSIPYSVPWGNSLFEDNAEYGYGILMADKIMKERIRKIMLKNMDNSNSKLFEKWLDNPDSYENTKDVYDNLTDEIPDELREIKDYIVKRSVWTIGGDGWAYDIGFSGIDHVLSSNDDANILVLDTQVYSNTGGQASKSTPKGAIASFAAAGKKNSKKDLAKIALAYPNAYVACISLGANMLQVIKAFKEAEAYKGPSIIIAYAPCISHGIKGGMQNSVSMEREATMCGYFPIFRYNPQDKKFTLDSKVDFNLYEEFLMKQARFKMLEKVNKEHFKELIEENKIEAMERYKYYEKLSKEYD